LPLEKNNFKLIYSESSDIAWENVTTSDTVCLDTYESGTIHLFNIDDDPNETANLYESSDFNETYSEIFDELWSLYETYYDKLASPVYVAENDSLAEQVWKQYNNSIVPWE